MPALETRMSTPPTLSTARRCRRSTGGLVGDVHRHAHGALPPAGSISRGDGLRASRVEVGDGDRRAGARQVERDFLADAAGRAGDDGDLAFEAHGGSLDYDGWR